MSASNPENLLGGLAAMAWVILWAIGFVALGFNHVATRLPDSRKLFLVGAVLGAFVASLWLVSSQPRSSAALILNLALASAVIFMAAVLWRNAALLAVRWSPNRQHNVMFVASRGWAAVVWLSIITSSAVPEVHHVLHSRAR